MSERPLVEVAIFTDRVDALKRFYGDLSGSAPEAEWPGGAIFSAGGVKILVHARGPGRSDGPANEDHVAFGVEDVDASFAALRARGCRAHVEPRDYPWGRSAYLYDPDGRIVELLQL